MTITTDNKTHCILEMPYVSPKKAFEQFANSPFAMFLDSSSNSHPLSRYSYIAVNPISIIKENPLHEINKLISNNKNIAKHNENFPTPFIGGTVGFLGYEFGKTLNDRSPDKADELGIPDFAFGIYDTIAAFNNKDKKAWIIAVDIKDHSTTTATSRAKSLQKKLLSQQDETSAPPSIPPINWTEETPQSEFEAMVEKTVDYIEAGDIYQANMTRRYIAELPLKPEYFELYKTIRKENPAPFSAFIRLDDNHAILSASPERFLSLSADGIVDTRPIKGTRPRIKDDAKADNNIIKELRNSDKDKSENLMIVDLMRNDISRVCNINSIKVPNLLNVETFETVHHIVSTVTGKLRDDKNASHLLAKTFPGGSITGAPKIRSMEIINELEKTRRGVYCGSIMWIGVDGSMDSNIVIRTMVASGKKLIVQAGGGIVAGSTPTDEYFETITKAKALLIN
ncbi:MAG: aminodeoxychorismate synthase component I [Alphaproteobacteria bacterium]|nr:aminodeoxychorismate synthase component I [Alphaproteobacteria bacterium]